jgi:hypothetical protein
MIWVERRRPIVQKKLPQTRNRGKEDQLMRLLANPKNSFPLYRNRDVPPALAVHAH